MNPGDLRMLWMNQYSGERMIFEDSTSFYGQPSVGLSVMDDMTHPTASIDLNPMMSIVGGEYGGQGTPIGGGHAAPTATLISTGTGTDIYGISHTIGSLHPVLQHTTSFQPYQDIIDDDVDQKPFGQHYEQIDDYEAIVENREIINIDDFVTMNNDSNSYEDAQIIEDDGSERVIEKKPQATTLSHNYDSSGSGSSRGNGNKKARKIEPINRPGLVLKTPIAYKGNIDPSVIPIQRDGMAVCERCGAIGVKHTFYTKSRRFCSMACARGELYTLVCNDNNSKSSPSASTSATSSLSTSASHAFKGQNGGSNQIAGVNNQSADIELELRVSHIKNSNYRFKMANDPTDLISEINGTGENGILAGDDKAFGTHKPMLYRDVLPLDEVPQIPKLDRLPSPCPRDDRIMSVRRRATDHLHSFDWTSELSKPGFYAAPVTCFSHAPGYDMWDNIGIDMKVEVENTDCDSQVNVAPGQTPHSFWVATVLNICGYKALMRYEGFDDSSHDFWVNLCSSEVHAVGWCATRGKPLIPPKTIENKYSDWKDFLVERLSGARTLPSNFYNKISDSFKSRFRVGLILELVDKNRISQVKLATVCKIVGKRLYLKYYDSDDGFWCHEDSPIIHPVGWATTVGHNLDAPQEYLDRMQAGCDQIIEVHEDDATIELFKMNFTFEEYYLEGKTNGFIEGMKLEAIDPLNLSSICVATVMAVLKFGYMMIRIDSYDPDATGADWFCYHEKSPCIFPVGFCAANGITLTPPNGYDIKTFRWDTYLDEKKSLPADEHLFHRDIPDHGFRPNMRLECADLMDPRLVCVATVSRVVGRLLKISFDGWPEEYDQWLDCVSPDIYPVGWCVLVGHKLEGPPVVQQPVVKTTPKAATRKKRKKKIKTENTGAKTIGRPPNVKKEMHDLQQPMNNYLSNDSRINVKLEMKAEPHDDEEEDDDDEEYDDDFSRSDHSTSLPVTPEPGEKMKLVVTSSSGVVVSSSNHSSTSMSSNSSSHQLQNIQKTTSPAPPAERKATSYIANSAPACGKYIPRLIDAANTNDSSMSSSPATTPTNTELNPETWNVHDVSQFLRANECTAHCDTFSRNKIDGKRLLDLSKDEIITMLGMKVGPALKIFDLIQQLKCKANPGKLRLLKTNIKKFS